LPLKKIMPPTQNITGKPDELLKLLLDLYWEAVSREVRMMILAYNRLTASPHFSEFQWAKNGEVLCDNFQSLFNTLSMRLSFIYVASND